MQKVHTVAIKDICHALGRDRFRLVCQGFIAGAAIGLIVGFASGLVIAWARLTL